MLILLHCYQFELQLVDLIAVAEFLTTRNKISLYSNYLYCQRLYKILSSAKYATPNDQVLKNFNILQVVVEEEEEEEEEQEHFRAFSR